MPLSTNIKNGLDALWDRIQSGLKLDNQENIRVTVSGNTYKIKMLKAPHPEITDGSNFVIKIYQK